MYAISSVLECEFLCMLSLQSLLETSDNLESLHFKLHDFGFRGSTSVEVSSI